MKRVMSILVVLLAVAAGGAAAPESSSAVSVGFGDQSGSAFGNQLFKDLGVRRVRVFTPWNVMAKRRDLRYLDQWLRGARAARVEPLVSFSAASGSRCPRRPCKLPSVRSYTRQFKKFRRKYRWVRVVSPWNEANHRSQPTFKNPKRAAQYYNAVRKACRGCRIVAADVIDEPNMVAWLKRFRRHARAPRIWGLHNYRDTNPRRGQLLGGTRKLLRTVRGQVWMTETGGIVKFVLPNRRTLFRFSERRANTNVARMFKLAKRYRRRIKRLYIYAWSQPAGNNRFDAGVIRANGTPRPAYETIRKNLRTSTFSP